jgi:hypothetical protein
MLLALYCTVLYSTPTTSCSLDPAPSAPCPGGVRGRGHRSPSISPSGNHCLLRLPGEQDQARTGLAALSTSLIRATIPHSLQQLLSAPIPSAIQLPRDPKLIPETTLVHQCPTSASSTPSCHVSSNLPTPSRRTTGQMHTPCATMMQPVSRIINPLLTKARRYYPHLTTAVLMDTASHALWLWPLLRPKSAHPVAYPALPCCTLT